MWPEERALYWKAVEVLLKFTEEQNQIAMQPSKTFSEVGSKYVYLRNGGGLLAKYNIKTGKIV